MDKLYRDPIINVIDNGIKRDINISFENKCFRACLILIYSGMDTMAYLNCPFYKDRVNKTDFIEWTNKYMRFKGKIQVPGVDFYGARCAVLHNYGVVSDMSRKGECRMIGYVNDNSVPVLTKESLDDMIIISIRHLKEAFFSGIDKFLIEVFKDKKRSEVIEKRFNNLIHMLTPMELNE